MRVFAWLLVLGLFLSSGLCFVVSYQRGVQMSNAPAHQLQSLAIALSRFVPHQADEVLTYLASKCNPADIGVVLGLASAGLGILCLVILAATHRRRRKRDDGEDDDELTEEDDMIARIRRL